MSSVFSAWDLIPLAIRLSVIFGLLYVAALIRGPRNSRSRAVSAVLAAVLLAGTATAAIPEPMITDASSWPCEQWDVQDYAPRRPADFERESAFVCVARKDARLGVVYGHASDADLIAAGRAMCGAVLRDDSAEIDRIAHTMGVALRAPQTLGVLTYLCPELQERERTKAHEIDKTVDDGNERAQKLCSLGQPHRPLGEPVHRGRAAVWPESGGFNGIEVNAGDVDYDAALDAAFTTRLVGAAPGDLEILIPDDFSPVCVTVETYRKRPPVETKGWSHVVEVGYHSPTGALQLKGDRTGDLPGLIDQGIGDYRIRVHKLAETYLIIVYPGTSKRVTRLK